MDFSTSLSFVFIFFFVTAVNEFLLDPGIQKRFETARHHEMINTVFSCFGSLHQVKWEQLLCFCLARTLLNPQSLQHKFTDLVELCEACLLVLYMFEEQEMCENLEYIILYTDNVGCFNTGEGLF